MDFDVSHILGVRVACLSREATLNRVMGWTGAGQDRSIFYVNAHCMNLAQQDLALFDWVTDLELHPAGDAVDWRRDDVAVDNPGTALLLDADRHRCAADFNRLHHHRLWPETP